MHGCGWGLGLGWGGIGGWVVVPLLLVAMLAVGWLIVKALAGHGGRRDSRDSLEILKRRLAAGEITVEEFEILKQHL